MNKATFVLIKLVDKLLIGQTGMDYAQTTTMIETSCKTNGDDATFVAGRTSSTISVTGMASTTKESTNTGYWELWALQRAGAVIEVDFTNYTTKDGTTAVIGDETMTVQCLISSLSMSAPDNDKLTFSLDLQVTGAPVRTTNA